MIVVAFDHAASEGAHPGHEGGCAVVHEPAALPVIGALRIAQHGLVGAAGLPAEVHRVLRGGIKAELMRPARVVEHEAGRALGRDGQPARTGFIL